MFLQFAVKLVSSAVLVMTCCPPELVTTNKVAEMLSCAVCSAKLTNRLYLLAITLQQLKNSEWPNNYKCK